MNARRLTIAAAALAAALCPARADEAAQAIIRRVDAAERSATARMEMEMTIQPADGGASRSFALVSHERTGKGEESLVEFLEPRTVRGLRILSLGRDSWVYFPSTGRVRKIAGSSRTGSVQGIGGDFSYDDLGGGAWADSYDFTLVAESATDWTLEGRRRSAEAAYDAVRLRVDRKLGLPTLAVFSLEKEGGWFKELSFSDFRSFSGRTRAAAMVMKNLKTGSRTSVALRSAAFDLPLEDRLFDPARFDK